MNRITQKIASRLVRKHRVRSTVSGTSERPRLTVTVSNRNVSAQIIDDTKHTTIVSATSVGSKTATGSLSDKAAWVGTEIATKAVKAKVKHVAFDRNGRLYHGRVQLLAEAARKAGLEF